MRDDLGDTQTMQVNGRSGRKRDGYNIRQLLSLLLGPVMGLIGSTMTIPYGPGLNIVCPVGIDR